MKTLTLVRHAKSSWGDPAPADRNRPLNERGLRDVARTNAKRGPTTELQRQRTLGPLNRKAAQGQEGGVREPHARDDTLPMDIAVQIRPPPAWLLGRETVKASSATRPWEPFKRLWSLSSESL
jgi:hypothetical protein